MKLIEFIDGWLSSAVLDNVKANTYTAYKGYTDNHISGTEIANIELADIQKPHIQDFVKNLKNKRTGEKLSPKSVRLVYSMLKTVFNAAYDYDYIDKNPCGKIRLPRLEEKEVKALTVKEQRKIEQAAASSKNDKAFGVIVCLYTGIRLGELCALKWTDIDFYRREIKISRTVCRVKLHGQTKDGAKTKIVEDTPKTDKSRRSVPVPVFLIKQLQERKRQSKSEYVLSMPNGKAVQPRTMQDVFYKLTKDSGIDHKSFHATRHTFATRAIELNINIATLSGMLGHSSTIITYNRYVHCMDEQKHGAARLFDKFFGDKKRSMFVPPQTDNIIDTYIT